MQESVALERKKTALEQLLVLIDHLQVTLFPLILPHEIQETKCAVPCGYTLLSKTIQDVFYSNGE